MADDKPVVVSLVPDERPGSVSLEQQANRLGYSAEERQIELDLKRLENAKLELENASLRQDIGLRKGFAWSFLALHAALIIAVVVLVALTGSGRYTLSDRVLMMLIASTVAELVGLVFAVVKYLFPAKS